jgi:hypothetical protein
MSCDADCALRFKLLNNPLIEVKADKQTMDGHCFTQIVFKIPCSKLRFDREKKLYYCSIHDTDQRPVMCEEFPDNVPLGEITTDDECPIIRDFAEKLKTELAVPPSPKGEGIPA